METTAPLERFYVTRESQEVAPEVRERKLNYVGLRNLTDLERIEERDIVGPDGAVVGVKNRVRAGVANFENPTALTQVLYRSNGANLGCNIDRLHFWWVGLHRACALVIQFFILLHTQRREEEGEVIVYTTSFRGVKPTFEECRYVLSVLYLFRVRTTQRDVYMNKSFYAELEARLLGGKDSKDAVKVTVPQVYISGQHIGVCV